MHATNLQTHANISPEIQRSNRYTAQLYVCHSTQGVIGAFTDSPENRGNFGRQASAIASSPVDIAAHYKQYGNLDGLKVDRVGDGIKATLCEIFKQGVTPLHDMAERQKEIIAQKRTRDGKFSVVCHMIKNNAGGSITRKS